MASLGAAEAEILKLVWDAREATVQKICDRLPPKRSIAYATVQTVLRRLWEKGFVKRRVEGKAHVFLPAINPDKVISRSVSDLVDRFFGGDAVPLVMHLARNQKIDRVDLKRLQDLLSQKDKPSGKPK